MSQHITHLSIRIICAIFIFSGISKLHAQVPVPGCNNLALAENSKVTERISKNVITEAASTVITVLSPSSTVPFGTATKSLLDMKGYDQEFTRSFTFKNTSSTTYTINSVDFEKQDNTFDVSAIEPSESLPIVVEPGKTFSVHIAFHAIDRNKISSNRLRITTEQNKEPIVYPIQALQQPLSDMPWNKHTATAQAK